ncbi:hypothetical protein RAH32_02310 [Paracoccus sp. WLY502]|uniref:hypothetical protein n=1 Tax=Paracoccus yibinensis TaxID=3068891 RepID=UPI0027964C6D|nr:hypothetical protein [Paracoccus sp. WLY502]MDQ1899277.1 hypothetical protein [Paracoccus sp. WLY502]
MARGFWTGLLHGGVVGIAALAVLSLAAPVPQPEPATPQPAELQSAEPQQVEPQPIEPQPAEPQPPEPRRSEPQPDDAPQAGEVDLPVGSEFGRGGDAAPRLPAPLVSERPALSETPAVIAPPSEPAPPAVTEAEPRPQPTGEQDGPVQAAPDAGENAPQLERPALLAQPSLPAVPGRAMADAPDAAPAMPLDLPGAAAPDLPAPTLDLSLPPDLTDLQGLSRD